MGTFFIGNVEVIAVSLVVNIVFYRRNKFVLQITYDTWSKTGKLRSNQHLDKNDACISW